MKTFINRYYGHDGMWKPVDLFPKVYSDGPKTVVILPDGRRGEAICAPDDEFNPVTGVAIAYGRALAQTK